jgi:hypothetical protein
MLKDLRTILEGWEYEPGRISVRKILGRDGREKIQTRIDLGVLQFETVGRPDGQRPFGCESLLEYQEQRLRALRAKGGDDADFVLSPEDCKALRHEGYLFYQRYLSQFVLEDFEAVERDTERNLRLIAFCERYAATEADRTALSNQRPYVTMMRCRARVYSALAQNECDLALRRVDAGIAELRAMAAADGGDIAEGEDRPCETELTVLLQLRREVIRRLPEDAVPRLQWELQAALDREDYEKAAKLRDQLAKRSRSPQQKVGSHG